MQPTFKAALCALGQAYLGQNKLKIAETVTKRVLVLDSNYQLARKLLGVILDAIKQACYDRGFVHLLQYDKAILYFEKVINMQPTFKAALCALGQAYLGQDKLKARKCSQKSPEIGRIMTTQARELLRAIKQAR